MKRLIILFTYIAFVLSVFLFFGCSCVDDIEKGTYICKNPYIKYSYFNSYDQTDEIEVNGIVYKSFSKTGYDGTITFIEYQEEDLNPNLGLVTQDNEVYAKFDYSFDTRKKQLILTDRKTGNCYHLDKINYE